MRLLLVLFSVMYVCSIRSLVAADFPLAADMIIDRINAVVVKTDPAMVAKKQDCVNEGGGLTCHYRGNHGPGINLMSREGAASVKAVVLIDVPGLSVNGTLYVLAMMEALDGSMDAGRRSVFFNKLIGDFAAGSGQLTNALPFYDPADRPSYAELLSHDARVMVRALALPRWTKVSKVMRSSLLKVTAGWCSILILRFG